MGKIGFTFKRKRALTKLHRRQSQKHALPASARKTGSPHPMKMEDRRWKMEDGIPP